MHDAPIEPSASARTFAKSMRQMHAALIAEGFTDRQALVIIGQVIAAGIARGPEPQ